MHMSRPQVVTIGNLSLSISCGCNILCRFGTVHQFNQLKIHLKSMDGYGAEIRDFPTSPTGNTNHTRLDLQDPAVGGKLSKHCR